MPVGIAGNPAGFINEFPIYINYTTNMVGYKTITLVIGNLVCPHTPYTETTTITKQQTPVFITKTAVAQNPATIGVIQGGATIGSKPIKNTAKSRNYSQILINGIGLVLVDNTQTPLDYIVQSPTNVGVGHKLAVATVKPGSLVASSLQTLTVSSGTKLCYALVKCA